MVIIGDVALSGTEARYFSFGRTDGERLLTVVFTVRGQLLRVVANKPDVPYQSLLKVFLAERIARETAAASALVNDGARRTGRSRRSRSGR